MGYNTSLTGSVTITPSLSHAELRGSPWTSREHPPAPGKRYPTYHTLCVAAAVTTKDTDEGRVTALTADSIDLAEEGKGNGRDAVLADVQALISAFPGHDFHGTIEGVGEEYPDIWRVIVSGRTARIVEPVITWPED